MFTTRPDTLFGASFVALSPDHPLTALLAAKDTKLAAFVAECHKGGTAEETIETAEKKGYDTGIKALHPLDPKWELPVYVANFVLMAYGTGAIFGCPAHDQRDLDFARKYKLPVLPVVSGWRRSSLRDRLRGLFGSRGLRCNALPRRAGRRQRQGRSVEPAGRGRNGPAHRPLSPARLAGVAAALLGLPDPDHPLRHVRHGSGPR